MRMCAEPADLGVIGGWEGGQKYRAVSCGADFTAAVVDEEGIPGGRTPSPNSRSLIPERPIPRSRPLNGDCSCRLIRAQSRGADP